MTKTPDSLVELAYDIVHSRFHSYEKNFNEGGDEWTELQINWTVKFGFEVFVIQYSDPIHYPGSMYEPPETAWREETETGNFRKIADVAKWLKDFGITL